MGSYKSYIIGFISSLILTLAAFYMVTQHAAFSTSYVILTIVLLAVAQLILQLVFFLHLGRSPKNRSNLLVFWFMLMVVFIIIGGSLWIMQNLNYHVNAHDSEKFIIKDEGHSH